MFNVWINKQLNELQGEHDYLVFNLFDKNNKSNIKTDIEQLWRRFGLLSPSELSEDLLIIAISLFCADKKIPRSDFWTREIKLNVPVFELEKWESVRPDLQRTLGFLSGDNWIFEFRKSTSKFRANKENTEYKLIQKSNYNSVCLFSGGLDSFCGALTLSEEKKDTCYVGFREYNLLSSRQEMIFNGLDIAYPQVEKELVLFNANPLAPLNNNQEKRSLGTESTSRSRSFLFLAGAILVASILGEKTPVYIPENGFIGVNIPLTESRNGSCSTRTTHPYFLRSLNDILNKIGLRHEVVNPFWNMSKGEIVQLHSRNSVFKEFSPLTLSCSHPCLCRYDKLQPPMNCGYCYPCLIRKASLISVGPDKTVYNEKYALSADFIKNYNNLQGKASDLKAVLFSINRYLNRHDDDFINNLLVRQGPLNKDEMTSYKRLYIKSMEELISMVRYEDKKNKGNLINYLGIEGTVCE